MSQIYKMLTSAGPTPPAIPTEFTTNNGIAVPAANNLNVFGRSSTEDNDEGITTQADPALSPNLYIELTNRIHGSDETTDATPFALITFPMTAEGTYIFDVKIAAFNNTDTLGAGYNVFGTCRSNGTDSFLVGTPDKIINEEGAMSACNVNLVVGGAGDVNATIQVIGLAGKSIEWCGVGYYCTIS